MTPAIVRAQCWLLSAGVHAIGFVAMGHPPVASALSQGRQHADALVLDVVLDPTSEPSEPVAIPAGLRSASFVPPPSHTHPYPVAPDHDAHPHDPSLVHIPFASPPTPSSETVVATPAPAHFAMLVSTESVGDHGPRPAAAATRAAVGPEPGGDDAPLPEETVSSPARLIGAMSPVYPPAARAQEVEADVPLAIVVTSSGLVADARVLAPAGFGFDEEALRSIRAARFTPAQRDGRPVAVRMRWSMSFRLH